MPVPGWSTQQLAEFVAAVSTAPDARIALRTGVERASEALDADVAAVVRDAVVVADVGWPRDAVPTTALLVAAAAPAGAVLPVPSRGDVPVAVVPLGDEPGGHLLVARAGEGFDAVELSLLRGMARTLALTLRSLRMLDDERGLRAQSDAHARDNARLLAILRERQRLLEGLAAIQRSIARRAPLHEVLEAIVTLVCELTGDEQVILYLRDPEEPDGLLVAASRGLPDGVAADIRRRRVGEGVAGQAVAEERLIVAEDYAAAETAMPVFLDRGLQAAMAAPVLEEGTVVGALLVSTYRRGRGYSPTDQEMLQTIAQHASLALTDAKTVSAMVHQALHDALTGLPNRALFGDRLEHAQHRAARTSAAIGVLFVDLDRFKTVNDSLGHAAGDELLRVVAERIGECMRSADTAARLGGDEFAVLLEDLTSSAEAVRVAQRIIESLRVPVVLDGREVFVSASIGVATATAEAGDLLRRADVAMYRAKAEGKGRYALYEEGMQAEVLERLELEGDLQRAVGAHAVRGSGDADWTLGRGGSGGELELFYQPIMALGTSAMVGVEALLRWRHPRRGLVPPLSFIPLAEETGLIHGIGAFVLREACRQAAAWRESGAPADMTMHVNLSGRQLEDPDLLDLVTSTLRETGLEPGALVLEITETVLMHDTEATIERLRALRALGVRLAVDDFGTGYSSLRYLNRFPVDVLKMAKPFIDGLGAGAEHSALARAIVDLGANLGLQIVAEGIERPEQLLKLRELGCALGQGFYFGMPMPAAGLKPLIVAGAPEIAEPA